VHPPLKRDIVRHACTAIFSGESRAATAQPSQSEPCRVQKFAGATFAAAGAHPSGALSECPTIHAEPSQKALQVIEGTRDLIVGAKGCYHRQYRRASTVSDSAGRIGALARFPLAAFHQTCRYSVSDHLKT
jgi:hypothetical protein